MSRLILNLIEIGDNHNHTHNPNHQPRDNSYSNHHWQTRSISENENENGLPSSWLNRTVDIDEFAVQSVSIVSTNISIGVSERWDGEGFGDRVVES